MAAPRYNFPQIRVRGRQDGWNANENRLVRTTMVAQDGERQAIVANVSPMMRPGTIRNTLGAAARRMTLYVGPFIDFYGVQGYRSNGAFIASVAIACVESDTTLRPLESQAMIIAQVAAVGYEEVDLAAPQDAMTRAATYFKARYNTFPPYIQQTIYVVDPNHAGGGDPPRVPPTWEGEALPTEEQVCTLLMALAEEETSKILAVKLFTSAVIMFSKRGNVTLNVVDKVVRAIRDELHMNITLDANVIHNAWTLCGHWITERNAPLFFHVWETAVGESCLRIKLLLDQAKWVGMTCYSNIFEAKSKFPDFPWEKLADSIPGEFTNFYNAVRVVGDNPFYGYKADLGVVKSTMYTNLAYCAYRLLVDIEGMRTLRDYQGMNRNVPHAAGIEALVRAYSAERLAKMTGGAPPGITSSEIVHTFKQLVPGVPQQELEAFDRGAEERRRREAVEAEERAAEERRQREELRRAREDELMVRRLQNMMNLNQALPRGNDEGN